MAAATTENKPKHETGGSRGQEAPLIQPPTYYMTSGPASMTFAASGSDPASCFQHGGYGAPLLQTSQPPTVMVTQPVVMAGAVPPDTTCALVMSTLSAILCGFWCGAIGILIAWKAKLHVLDKQFEHARHSLRIVWLFFSLACLFGGAVWIAAGVYIYLMTNYTYWY